MAPQKDLTNPIVSRAIGQVRTGGRSARVVRDVLASALEVFAERGYAAFSVEEAAKRAGVNKTTVYRRWPSKADLLAAGRYGRDRQLADRGDREFAMPAHLPLGDVRQVGVTAKDELSVEALRIGDHAVTFQPIGSLGPARPRTYMRRVELS